MTEGQYQALRGRIETSDWASRNELRDLVNDLARELAARDADNEALRQVIQQIRALHMEIEREAALRELTARQTAFQDYPKAVTQLNEIAAAYRACSDKLSAVLSSLPSTGETT